MALNDSDCPAHDRPIEEDVCEALAPCPGEASWETGPWSKVLGATRALYSDKIIENIAFFFTI